MLRHATTWFACLAVSLTTITVDNNAEAFHRHRRGYAYGGYYGGYQTAYYGGGWGGDACCGVAAYGTAAYSYPAVTYQQPLTYQQPITYQQPMTYQQPIAYQQTGWSGNACSVQPAGYQATGGMYHQTTGYAPQGGYGVQGTYQGQAPPPPAEADNAPPRTFDRAPEPEPPEPENNNNNNNE